MKKSKSCSGMVGPLRTPMAGNGIYGKGGVSKPKLNPSVAANTTRPGISKQSAPIRTPTAQGQIVRYKP